MCQGLLHTQPAPLLPSPQQGQGSWAGQDGLAGSTPVYRFCLVWGAHFTGEQGEAQTCLKRAGSKAGTGASTLPGVTTQCGVAGGSGNTFPAPQLLLPAAHRANPAPC